MLTKSWRFRLRGLAWAILLSFLAPVVVLSDEIVPSVLLSGILDDDGDDDVIATLSSPDLKLIALAPSPLPDLPRLVGDPAPIQTDHPATFVSVLPTLSRSPPLS